MPSYVSPKINTAYIFYVSLVSQANTKIFQANPTLAAGDVKVATDDAAPVNLATLPAVDADLTKRIKVSLSAAEMNGDNITIIFSDAAGAEWNDLTVNIQTTTRQIDDLAYPTTSGRSMVVDAAGLVDANAVKVGPTGVGTVQTAGDIIGDTNDIQTRLPAALVAGRMDSDVGAIQAAVITAAAIAPDAIGASELAADAVIEIRSLASGTSDSGSTTTMVDAARTEADTDYWKGAIIVFTSGNIAGQSRLITAFNAATDTITFAPALTQAVITQTYEIWPAGRADLHMINGVAQTATLDDIEAQTDDIGAAGAGLTAITGLLPAALVGGRIDASVGALAGIVQSLTDLKDFADDGYDPATNKVQGVVLVDTLTTYTGNTPQTGDSFARIGAAGAGLTAVPWNAAWDAEAESEVLDALNTILADSIPADGTLPTVRQALYMLVQFMLERAVSATTVSVKKADGVTELFTLTLNDATTPTSITRAT